MFRKEFPDLQWLKNQIQQRFASKEGWPNVILHTKSQTTFRPDVQGTLSLFMNIKGQSRCGVSKELLPINDDTFFISNQNQSYTLAIENTCTETFNIHFSEKLVSEVYSGLVLPNEKLLDNPLAVESSPIEFYNRLYAKDKKFSTLIHKLYTHSQSGFCETMLAEEQLTDVLVYLAGLHKNVWQEIRKVPVVKKATREEIYRRLSYSLNYLHSFYTQELNLDELATIACLSKFHYLRLFKTVFQQTPYQYLLQLRLQKAEELLKHTQLPITAISVELGFVNITSFSRLFHQRYQLSPLQYRIQNGSSRKLSIAISQ